MTMTGKTRYNAPSLDLAEIQPSAALLRPCMSRNLTSELLWASRDPLIGDALTFNQKSAIDAK